MSAHDKFKNDLPLYLTGDLEPGAVGRLEAHLADCEECRRELVESQAALDMLKRAGEAGGGGRVPTGFYEERLEPRLGGRGPLAGLLLRVAALLLAFLTGMAVDRALGVGEPAEEAAPDGGREVYAAYSRGNGLARAWIALSELSRKPK